MSLSYFLCYCAFYRIILNLSDMSTIFVSNSLMGTKIEKVRWGNWYFLLLCLHVRNSWYCSLGQAFPNLKATVAFSFVFKAEENQRLSDLRSLQKKTMVSLPLLWKFLHMRQFGLILVSEVKVILIICSRIWNIFVCLKQTLEHYLCTHTAYTYFRPHLCTDL